MFDEFGPFLIFGVALLIIIGSVAYTWYANKRRREALSLLANQWMYDFTEKNDELRDALDAFHLLNRGRSKKVRNVLQGQERGVEVQVFDYLHTTGSGRSSREHTESVVLLRSSRLALPFFTVRPKGTFEFIRKRFGKSAISFGDDPMFDEKYLVFAAKDAAPEPVVQTLKMNAREHIARDGKWVVEGNKDRLVIYRERKKLKPDELRTLLDESLALFNHFAKSDGWS